MKFAKRILSLLLAVVMIVTMFSGTLTSFALLRKDAYWHLGNPASSQAEIDAAVDKLEMTKKDLVRPTPTFYVPELIFVDNAGTIGQYFYGVDNNGAVTKNASLNTAAAGALVYWDCPGATDIKITAEVSTSQYLGNDGRDDSGNRSESYVIPSDTSTNPNGIASMTVGGTALNGADASSAGWTASNGNFTANMTALQLNSAVSVLYYLQMFLYTRVYIQFNKKLINVVRLQ